MKHKIIKYIKFWEELIKRVCVVQMNGSASLKEETSMNKIYKVVWSKVKHCYVVTSELAKRQTKGCGARSLRMAAVTTGVTAALLCNGGGTSVL